MPVIEVADVCESYGANLAGDRVSRLPQADTTRPPQPEGDQTAAEAEAER